MCLIARFRSLNSLTKLPLNADPSFSQSHATKGIHDDVIKWKHFPRYWPFVWGIHQSTVNSPHKGQ